MESNQVKLLNNYQLFQLTQNKLLDNETIARVQQELVVRRISTIELNELNQRYESSLDGAKAQLEENTWHPFYTAFSWKRHFKHVALLKTFGKTKEEKAYQLSFYAGMTAYMLLFILLIVLL